MKKWIQQRAAQFHRPTEQMQSFYNRIHRFYWLVEKHIRPGIQEVIQALSHQLPIRPNQTVVEYCCGSGILSQQLATQFSHVTARDLSAKMLSRAQKLAKGINNVTFEEGNVLDIRDAAYSFDYAFISFGLHLFSPNDQKYILETLLQVVKEEVIIIEHLPKWQLPVALVEWWEGSHYSDFINTNWRAVANEMNVQFAREIIGNTQVQRWRKK